MAKGGESEMAASATKNTSCKRLLIFPAVVLVHVWGCRRKLTQALNGQHGVTHEAVLLPWSHIACQYQASAANKGGEGRKSWLAAQLGEVLT